MDSNYNNLRQWIASNLFLKSMNIKDLAKETGLSRAIIYMYMSDKARPKTSTINKLCAVLGRPLEEGLLQYSQNPVGRPQKAIQQV